MNYVPDYSIEKLHPADYNPRVISADAFEKLKESISKYGMVKPIILNGTGILTAGHQRIRACKSLGINNVPAILLKDISLHDEIKFNLFHNSIETNKTDVKILNIQDVPFGYSFVDSINVICGDNKNAPVTKHIADLYLRYDNWGSVVVDEFGNIILNSDYAYVMKSYNQPVLIYKMPNTQIDGFLAAIGIDYGEYNYGALNIKPYVQYHCQMNRIKSDEKESIRSTLYEQHLLKVLKKEQNIIDFGAGKFVYVNYLKSKGYNILGYEPYFKKNNHQILISKVIKDIDNIRRNVILNKLFDIVILDSVINSITSLDYENYVMTTCNALMKSNGTFYMATRSMEKIDERTRATKTTMKSRIIEFLDKNNFSATFRQGNWTLQRFHTVESLKSLVEKYFNDVKVIRGTSQNYAICKSPKNLGKEKYIKALEIEFNMEYPDNFRHNTHKPLVEEILKNLEERCSQ